MKRSIRSAGLAVMAVLAAAPIAQATEPPVRVQQAAGTSAAAIQSAVDAYRADLGGALNTTPGSAGSGRREINWDAVPDARSAPNLLPVDFFNATVPRGVVFDTPGSGFQVSGAAGIAPVEFDNLHPSHSADFATFSPQRLFTALDSTVTEVRFFEPGGSAPATVSGFGAVFTDVDGRGTRIAYYDKHDRRIASYRVPASPGNETLSFLGVRFTHDRVAKVRITSGTSPLGRPESRHRDAVAMDDFVFGEPSAY